MNRYQVLVALLFAASVSVTSPAKADFYGASNVRLYHRTQIMNGQTFHDYVLNYVDESGANSIQIAEHEYNRYVASFRAQGYDCQAGTENPVPSISTSFYRCDKPVESSTYTNGSYSKHGNWVNPTSGKTQASKGCYFDWDQYGHLICD